MKKFTIALSLALIMIANLFVSAVAFADTKVYLDEETFIVVPGEEDTIEPLIAADEEHYDSGKDNGGMIQLLLKKRKNGRSGDDDVREDEDEDGDIGPEEEDEDVDGGSGEIGDDEDDNEAGEGCEYLIDYLHIGWNNNADEVFKLQNFLNNYMGSGLKLTGVFDQATFEAVKNFQTEYKEEILDPWNIDYATGFVYITTKRWINHLYCPEREIEAIPQPLIPFGR